MSQITVIRNTWKEKLKHTMIPLQNGIKV